MTHGHRFHVEQFLYKVRFRQREGFHSISLARVERWREFMTKDNSRVMRGIDRISLAAVAITVMSLAGRVAATDTVGKVLLEVLMVLIGVGVVLLSAMDIFDFIDSNFGTDEIDEEIEVSEAELKAVVIDIQRAG